MKTLFVLLLGVGFAFAEDSTIDLSKSSYDQIDVFAQNEAIEYHRQNPAFRPDFGTIADIGARKAFSHNLRGHQAGEYQAYFSNAYSALIAEAP